MVRKFSISSPTTQRDQMPLSNIFSASTSNALYKPKIVMENNSATQPQKITAGGRVYPELAKWLAGNIWRLAKEKRQLEKGDVGGNGQAGSAKSTHSRFNGKLGLIYCLTLDGNRGLGLEVTGFLSRVSFSHYRGGK